MLRRAQMKGRSALLLSSMLLPACSAGGPRGEAIASESSAITLAADNLVTNPSFETNTTGWSSWQGSITRTARTDAPHGGYVAKVTRTTGTSYSIDDTSPVVASTAPSARYSAFVYMRAASTSAVGKPAQFAVREYSGSTEVNRWESNIVPLSNTWQKLEIAEVTPAAGHALDVFAYQGNAKIGDALFIDAVEVRRTDTTSTPDGGPPWPTTRDPKKWPFASTSIWNMPIGSNAQYVPAGIDNTPRDDGWAPMPGVDKEMIVMHPEAPALTIAYSSAGWSDTSRCSSTGTAPSWTGLPVTVPVPSSFIVPSDGGNNCASFLMADGHTIVEVQPFTRCAGKSYGTALLRFTEYPIDLYGDGAYGSHGGSGLSGVGGSLRVGELQTEAPRHALKMNVDPEVEFGTCTSAAASCRTSVQNACCYRWPAYAADSAMAEYGALNPTKTKAMKMGSLLAIPASTNILALGLETEPGRMLAWTLQNYGTYIVDSTGGAALDFSAENGPDGSFDASFQAKWGYPFEGRVHDGDGNASNAAFVRDVRRVVAALYVVANNGPTSIGGGGTPRQPLAPAL